MKYIIMCGGSYDIFKIPKQLSIINGEKLVERTIRLLKDNGIKDIAISSNDPRFDEFGVERLEHENSYKFENGKIYGYWLDAYYPMNKPCVYLHGDVYYSENAIKKIINCKPNRNIFIGNKLALNEKHIKMGEPFGWIVVNQSLFKKGIKDVKKLQDQGKIDRGYAISWELYEYITGRNVNDFIISEDTYLCIDDETDDVDMECQIEELNKKVKGK